MRQRRGKWRWMLSYPRVLNCPSFHSGSSVRGVGGCAGGGGEQAVPNNTSQPSSPENLQRRRKPKGRIKEKAAAGFGNLLDDDPEALPGVDGVDGGVAALVVASVVPVRRDRLPRFKLRLCASGGQNQQQHARHPHATSHFQSLEAANWDCRSNRGSFCHSLKFRGEDQGAARVCVDCPGQLWHSDKERSCLSVFPIQTNQP